MEAYLQTLSWRNRNGIEYLAIPNSTTKQKKSRVFLGRYSFCGRVLYRNPKNIHNGPNNLFEVNYCGRHPSTGWLLSLSVFEFIGEKMRLHEYP